jgi:hypothetical protein
LRGGIELGTGVVGGGREHLGFSCVGYKMTILYILK